MQHIQILDGFSIPLCTIDGLALLERYPHTAKECFDLLHVVLVSENIWDTSLLDHEFDENSQWTDFIVSDPFANHFDEIGNYQKRRSLQHMSYFNRLDGKTPDDNIDRCVIQDMFLASHQSL
jgi:hypothetical protein